jgi:hypothetical protein
MAFRTQIDQRNRSLEPKRAISQPKDRYYSGDSTRAIVACGLGRVAILLVECPTLADD